MHTEGGFIAWRFWSFRAEGVTDYKKSASRALWWMASPLRLVERLNLNGLAQGRLQRLSNSKSTSRKMPAEESLKRYPSSWSRDDTGHETSWVFIQLVWLGPARFAVTVYHRLTHTS